MRTQKSKRQGKGEWNIQILKTTSYITITRLLISKLKMAILTMYEYVCRNAVVLPGDKKVEIKPARTVEEQVEMIMRHMEDLETVNVRVRGSEMTRGYMRALASERSDLRIDY